MSRISFRSISENSARVSLFVFFSLLVFSTAFFVFAEDSSTGKNIFQDSDQDGLSNDEEKLYGTDPFNKDTDGDGYSDGVEVESGYDPLKKAPGDKIVKDVPKDSLQENQSATVAQNNSLTAKVSNEIATTIKASSDTNEPVTLDQMNASVQKILNENSQEVVLPEIDMKDIKIKDAPSKKLSDKKRAAQEHEDILQYLTVMSYLIANNSPKPFHTQSDFNNILTTLSGDSLTAVSTGDISSLNELSKKGAKMLDEMKDIEVPKAMLDIHVKALKIAKYATQLKTDLHTNQDDPLGKIADLSKIQGFVGVVSSFSQEIATRLASEAIGEIPISF